jgi:Na+-translocating ferredoxin:NAD+ oxidoreductase RnfA subunit
MKTKELLITPILKNNPITLQILGICSALAVTSSLSVTMPPSGRRPMTSVNVPPRSIQNCQPAR